MDQMSKEKAILVQLANCLVFAGLLVHCSSSLSGSAYLFSLPSNAFTLTDFLLAAGIAIHLGIGSDTRLPVRQELIN